MSANDHTPSYQTVRLWDVEHQAIRIIAAYNDTPHRDVYAAAFAQLVAKRSQWVRTHPCEQFTWYASPQPGDDRREVGVGLLPFEVADLEEWADTDGVSLIVARYIGDRAHHHSGIVQRAHNLELSVGPRW